MKKLDKKRVRNEKKRSKREIPSETNNEELLEAKKS